MVKKKIRKIKKKYSKINVKVKKKVSELEESIVNSEDQSFSNFVSSGRAALPSLTTGQEVINRAGARASTGSETKQIEERENINYGPRRKGEARKYEAVMLKGSANSNEGSRGIGPSGFREMSAQRNLGEQGLVNDSGDRKYETKEDSQLRVKRRKGWAA